MVRTSDETGWQMQAWKGHTSQSKSSLHLPKGLWRNFLWQNTETGTSPLISTRQPPRSDQNSFVDLRFWAFSPTDTFHWFRWCLSMLSWTGPLPLLVKRQYPTYKLLLLDVFGFTWFYIKTAKYERHWCLLTLSRYRYIPHLEFSCLSETYTAQECFLLSEKTTGKTQLINW